VIEYPDMHARTWVRTIREGKALCKRFPEVLAVLTNIIQQEGE